jgi:hypothetical protein
MLSARLTATLTQVLRVAAAAIAGVASATVSETTSGFFDITIQVTFEGRARPDVTSKATGRTQRAEGGQEVRLRLPKLTHLLGNFRGSFTITQ